MLLCRKKIQKKNTEKKENYSADYIEEHAEHCGQRIFDIEERRERARADLGIFFFVKNQILNLKIQQIENFEIVDE